MGKSATELFREKLNEIMTTRGTRNATLARALGVDPTTVTAWRKGKASPQLGQLTPICDYFGVDLDYFFPGAKAAEAAAKMQSAADELVAHIRAYNELAQRLVRSSK